MAEAADDKLPGYEHLDYLVEEFGKADIERFRALTKAVDGLAKEAARWSHGRPTICVATA